MAPQMRFFTSTLLNNPATREQIITVNKTKWQLYHYFQQTHATSQPTATQQLQRYRITTYSSGNTSTAGTIASIEFPASSTNDHQPSASQRHQRTRHGPWHNLAAAEADAAAVSKTAAEVQAAAVANSATETQAAAAASVYWRCCTVTALSYNRTSPTRDTEEDGRDRGGRRGRDAVSKNKAKQSNIRATLQGAAKSVRRTRRLTKLQQGSAMAWATCRSSKRASMKAVICRRLPFNCVRP
jgi:hypothetical protein